MLYVRYAVTTTLGLALVFGALWLGIETGYQSAKKETCAYQHGTMVVATKALNEMRSGDTNAIATIQSLGFAAALHVLESCADNNNTNLPSFKALVDYRRAHRANVSEWTPAEEKLELLLSERFGTVQLKQ